MLKIRVMNISKQDLGKTLKRYKGVSWDQSPLFKKIYNEEFSQFGGEPYGCLVGDYHFDHSAPDVELLREMAKIAAAAHCPFIAGASPAGMQMDSWQELANPRDLTKIFTTPEYAAWRSLRESDDARYLGLCMPRFMLRAPYGRRESELSVKAFDFSEEVIDEHERYLWGAASIAMTARIADSFAKYRWCPNIIGPQGGGSVHALPLHQYEKGGELQTKVPVEVSLDDRREFELAEQGFISMVFRKDSDNASFFSANSIQKPKIFAKTPEGLAAQTNYMLGTRLPYMFVITRLAHYLKVLQREQIGSWKSRSDLDRELNQWIRQYVSDMPDPPAETRSRKPLKKARITVEEVEGQVGWFRCSLHVLPHLKFEGAEFELSLVGKLDKS